MTKAEERAKEKYPEQDMYSAMLDGSNRLKREVYVEGYEQAEKDTIKRAAKWLENVSLLDYQDEEDGTIYFGEMAKDLRKAMMEEEDE